MDDLTFLGDLASQYGFGKGTLKVALPNGQVEHVSDCINPNRLLDRCPLLYHVFEFGHQSRLQANIEAPSRTAVICLLRYCYTGSYLPQDTDCGSILFLPHVQMFRMAEDFDVPELQLLAHGNFSCQISFACSLPEPPQDLLETIQYIYMHFSSPQSRQHDGLHQTLLNYCISVFQYHKLAENVQFLWLVRDLPEFRQDLCLTNMNRDFQDDCAAEIIQLALDMLEPRHDNPPTTLASRDLPAEMLVDRPSTPPCPTAFDPVRDAMGSIESERDDDGDSNLEDSAIFFANPSCLESSMLAYRPKMAQPVSSIGFETESSSEDEGFSIVHRTKPAARPLPEDLMSSPEIIPSNMKTVDVLAMTGSVYPDDDDWTLL